MCFWAAASRPRTPRQPTSPRAPSQDSHPWLESPPTPLPHWLLRSRVGLRGLESPAVQLRVPPYPLFGPEDRARRGRAGSALLANPLRAGGAARVNPWRPALQGRRKGQEADVPLEASRAAGNPSPPRGWSLQKLGRGRPRARTHPPCAAAAAAVPRVPRADPAPMAGPYFMLPSPGGKCGRAPWAKATLWVKAQHEGALPPPCIVHKDPRVPHTVRRGA